MMILVIILGGIFFTKAILHYRLLSEKKDSFFIKPNTFLDNIVPLKRRVAYFKIYISSLMFPVLSKSGNSILKKKINIMVLSFYLTLIVWLFINMKN
jgi:hypothetical protein